MANMLEIVFVVDRSGSMYGTENDIIGGFNSMIREQRENEQDAYVSTVLFSDTCEVLYDRVKLHEIKSMTTEDYKTGGCTALLDALGDAIKHIKNVHKYARKEDVPTKTLFIVMTDGEENASHKYNNKQIKKMVQEQQEEFRWEFIFVGADIDAFASAESIGVKASRAVRFSKDSDQFEDCFHAVGNVMACMAKAAPDEIVSDDAFCDIFKIFNKDKS